MLQGDWGIPLTANAAVNDFSSRLFVRYYNGFGSAIFDNGFPIFPFLNSVLAPFGFVGGVEIKILAVSVLAFSGVTTYFLARSFRLGKSSSFLAGLFFMSTPVVFNWLMFGWFYYLIAYAFLPLMILFTKKFIETNNLCYALANGLVLSIATQQPTFVLIYPIFCFLFILFESNRSINLIKSGIKLIIISLSVWSINILSFFVSQSNEKLTIFSGYLFEPTKEQFRNFYTILNPIRLWGSTYNFQFETYFPYFLTFFSLVTVTLAFSSILFRPRNKRVLFFSSCYLFFFMAYVVYHNMEFLVFNLPYGSLFTAPSIFLVPASLGLALLIGYSSDSLSALLVKFKNVFSPVFSRRLAFVVVLAIIILAGFPWWSGQASGMPIHGLPTKLNLYKVPPEYLSWSSNFEVEKEYFVFYIPLQANAQIKDSTIFSQEHEGVYGGIFTMVNEFPYVSFSNATLLLDELMNDSSDVGERWGSYSIKYIVVYTNVLSAYNMSDILNCLSKQRGIAEVASFPSVVVFENQYAKPVIHSENDKAKVQIVHIDPTFFRVQVNSNGPFNLVLNQMYSSDWKIWVNGTILPESKHSIDSNGFNRWQINQTGVMDINIYYEPQTQFLLSKILVIVTFIIILSYIAFQSQKTLSQKMAGKLIG